MYFCALLNTAAHKGVMPIANKRRLKLGTVSFLASVAAIDRRLKRGPWV